MCCFFPATRALPLPPTPLVSPPAPPRPPTCPNPPYLTPPAQQHLHHSPRCLCCPLTHAAAVARRAADNAPQQRRPRDKRRASARPAEANHNARLWAPGVIKQINNFYHVGGRYVPHSPHGATRMRRPAPGRVARVLTAPVLALQSSTRPLRGAALSHASTPPRRPHTQTRASAPRTAPPPNRNVHRASHNPHPLHPLPVHNPTCCPGRNAAGDDEFGFAVGAVRGAHPGSQVAMELGMAVRQQQRRRAPKRRAPKRRAGGVSSSSRARHMQCGC